MVLFGTALCPYPQSSTYAPSLGPLLHLYHKCLRYQWTCAIALDLGSLLLSRYTGDRQGFLTIGVMTVGESGGVPTGYKGQIDRALGWGRRGVQIKEGHRSG